MSVVSEVEERALGLSTQERGMLITKLLRSLPEFPTDADDGLAEALRRREEMREHPELALSLEELDRRMRERFG